MKRSMIFNYCFLAVLLLGPFCNGVVLATDQCPVPASLEATDKIVFAVKDDQPLILVDIAPEAEIIAKLKSPCQEVSVARRALLIVMEEALQRDEYSDYSTFLVRVLNVIEYDDYDQPQWFSAPVVALYEIERSVISSSSPELLKSMSLKEMDRFFRSKKVNLDNLDE